MSCVVPVLQPLCSQSNIVLVVHCNAWIHDLSMADVVSAPPCANIARDVMRLHDPCAAHRDRAQDEPPHDQQSGALLLMMGSAHGAQRHLQAAERHEERPVQPNTGHHCAHAIWHNARKTVSRECPQIRPPRRGSIHRWRCQIVRWSMHGGAPPGVAASAGKLIVSGKPLSRRTSSAKAESVGCPNGDEHEDAEEQLRDVCSES